MEKPTLETVKAAIKTVLSYDTSNDRRAAQMFLESLENSVHGWEISDQLLASHDGIDVSYLAAHMLRRKISKNFSELPHDCYDSLKNSILNHLQSFEDYAVQGQLTMAISDLTLLLHEWKNPIEDLAKQLGLDVGLETTLGCDYTTVIKALHSRLIFASIIHQMCDLNHNRTERPCRIGARRREEFEDYLISKCQQAITWWLNTLREINVVRGPLENSPTSTEADFAAKNKCLQLLDKLVGQIYLCYSAWLRIFDEENANESLPLVDSAFNHLQDIDCSEHIHKNAVEVVVATTNFVEDMRSVNYLIDHLVTRLYVLEETFKQSIQNEDIEKSSSLARAFTSISELALPTHVIEKKDFRIVELMLGCLVHFDFEVVEETFSFWWLYIEQIQNRLKQDEYASFVPYVNKFVMAVIKLCHFDPDEDSVIPRDQDIHTFRANSEELICNVMYITTVQDFIRDNNILQELLMNHPWEKTEANLFLISCLSSLMISEETALWNQIFQCILRQQTKIMDLMSLANCDQLPIKIGVSEGEVHPQIVATTLKIFGAMENFLADYPDYLILAIKYILTSINNEKYRTQLMRHAAKALANIMEQNASRHRGGYPQLMVIVRELCTNLSGFDTAAASELLRCGAYMSGAISDINLKDQFLCDMIRPIMKSLTESMQKPDRDDTELTTNMDHISSFFKQINLRPQTIPELRNFISVIDKELWPIIFEVLVKGAEARGETIEKSCRAIRYIIRSLKPEWMIQRVADTMINLYRTYPQNSSPLYICSILVDEFANKSAEINQGLFAMLEIFCTLTFTLLEVNASQSQSLLTMKSYPETIDDMMRLFTRFMTKCPDEFVHCKALESIIELSISSLRIDHPDANENVSKFVRALIELAQTNKYPHITEAVRNVLGARITDSVIKACLFDIPLNLIGNEAEVLHTLRGFDKELYANWVTLSTSGLPKTNSQGLVTITPEQLQDFQATLASADSVKRIVSALRATVRLYT